MKIIAHFNKSDIIKIVGLNLLMLLALTSIQPVICQETSQTLLNEGLKSYHDGDLDQAIVKLSSCLEMAGLSQEEKTSAYKYLAQAYMAKEYRDQAITAIMSLLKIMPNYKPDPVQDRPDYVKLVDYVRNLPPEKPGEAPGPKSSLKKWLLIGGGVATGVVLAVLLWPGEEESQLPNPPDLP